MINKKELQDLGVSAREFSKGMAIYLGHEWTDAFYQHIMRVLNGEVESTHEEDVASNYWLFAHQEPHSIASRYFAIMDKKKSLETLRRYARTGVFNGNQVDRIFADILKHF